MQGKNMEQPKLKMTEYYERSNQQQTNNGETYDQEQEGNPQMPFMYPNMYGYMPPMYYPQYNGYYAPPGSNEFAMDDSDKQQGKNRGRMQGWPSQMDPSMVEETMNAYAYMNPYMNMFQPYGYGDGYEQKESSLDLGSNAATGIDEDESPPQITRTPKKKMKQYTMHMETPERVKEKRGRYSSPIVSTLEPQPTVSEVPHYPTRYHIVTEPLYNRGVWTHDEHYRFLEGVNKYGKGRWKDVATVVGTRSRVQVASHAQKFYQRLEREEKYGYPTEGLDDNNQSNGSISNPRSEPIH